MNSPRPRKSCQFVPRGTRAAGLNFFALFPSGGAGGAWGGWRRSVLYILLSSRGGLNNLCARRKVFCHQGNRYAWRNSLSERSGYKAAAAEYMVRLLSPEISSQGGDVVNSPEESCSNGT